MDNAAFVEIDSDDLPVFFGLGLQRIYRHGAGDIIEGVAAADHGGGCGRAECRAHLLLAHARLDRLQIGLTELVAMLDDIPAAAR